MNLFGTDGIRGLANKDLTCEIAFKLGRAVATFCPSNKQICVGKDTRASGDTLEESLIQGIISGGVNAVRLGVITTPGLSFLVNRFNLGGGVMISASHNSFEYNGLKVFDRYGRKISERTELEFSKMIRGEIKDEHLPHACRAGQVIDGRYMVQSYVRFLSSLPQINMPGRKVLIDAANGSAAKLAIGAWETSNANVSFINCSPDGKNINRNCGSTYPSFLAREVVNGDYDVGFAYDGDGDRCIAVDEKGNVVSGDHILALMASDMARFDKLTKNTVVGTVMANLGLEQYLLSQDITLLRTSVGDRFVLQEMDRGGYALGGEQSGHIIFRDILPSGDGILTSLLFASILARSNRTLSELAAVVPQIPQLLVNIKSEYPRQVVESVKVQRAVESVSAHLAGKGRVLVRPSGTEPVVRIMVESNDEMLLEQCIHYLKSVIREQASIQ